MWMKLFWELCNHILTLIMPNSTYIWIQTDFFTIKANLAFTCNEFILGENLDLKSKLNQCRGLLIVYYLDYDNCKKCLLSFLKRLYTKI